MLFNSLKFIYFIVSFFTIYRVLKKKIYKKIFVLVSSYFFYGFWNWKFLSLLMLSTLIDYYCGSKIFISKSKKIKKRFLITSVISNLTILGIFKYFNFFVESLSDLLLLFQYDVNISTLSIILPVGISFYTFQTMSYSFDIYKDKIRPADKLMDFAIYVAFFPQLVAGPIERARHLLPQIINLNKPTIRQIREGANLVFLGYLKKVIISDQIAFLVDRAFENWKYQSTLYLWLGLIAFSIQIYFDFSGYSNIARGISKFFGIDLMVNFKQPYLSTNITDFWRRWHISLSSWLRDYLYIPLGGNRKGEMRTYINLILTMLLGGLWHGASWNFVIWGGMHGLYLCLHKLFFKGKVKEIVKGFDLIKKIPHILFTYMLVLFTWLPFRAKEFDDLKGILYKLIFFDSIYNGKIIIIISLLMLILFLIDIPQYFSYDWVSRKKILINMRVINYLFILIFVFFILILQKADKPFIYFQF